MSKTAQTAATDTDTDTGDNATSKNPPHYLMWFRRDLRIHDNTALAALSLDQKNAWVWDNDARAWQKLGDEYLSSVIKAVRMANKLVPADLIKLPIKAAE